MNDIKLSPEEIRGVIKQEPTPDQWKQKPSHVEWVNLNIALAQRKKIADELEKMAGLNHDGPATWYEINQADFDALLRGLRE